ncbi:hypothetical protein LRP30_13505 [Bradyrhizobium sp. C-145]|uniref:hypothetical protein n=1 Tax=Bradyrhizobium sp. C-145 TaxID=574727 RepID=UPI00201B4E54|nr:hypothetical protein [Bradyrhizobium sp. C-145]UQR66202.1 hypothetical protein LRP30_13505 [Bradyrhizobium sp. C-145]
MTNQLSGPPVDVDPFEVIQLRTTTVENFSTHYNADVNTLAVEYVAYHKSLLTSGRQVRIAAFFRRCVGAPLWDGSGHRRAATTEHKAGQWLIELPSLSQRRDQQSFSNSCRKRNTAIR